MTSQNHSVTNVEDCPEADSTLTLAEAGDYDDLAEEDLTRDEPEDETSRNFEHSTDSRRIMSEEVEGVQSHLNHLPEYEMQVNMERTEDDIMSTDSNVEFICSEPNFSHPEAGRCESELDNNTTLSGSSVNQTFDCTESELDLHLVVQGSNCSSANTDSDQLHPANVQGEISNDVSIINENIVDNDDLNSSMESVCECETVMALDESSQGAEGGHDMTLSASIQETDCESAMIVGESNQIAECDSVDTFDESSSRAECEMTISGSIKETECELVMTFGESSQAANFKSGCMPDKSNDSQTAHCALSSNVNNGKFHNGGYEDSMESDESVMTKEACTLIGYLQSGDRISSSSTIMGNLGLQDNCASNITQESHAPECQSNSDSLEFIPSSENYPECDRNQSYAVELSANTENESPDMTHNQCRSNGASTRVAETSKIVQNDASLNICSLTDTIDSSCNRDLKDNCDNKIINDDSNLSSSSMYCDIGRETLNDLHSNTIHYYTSDSSASGCVQQEQSLYRSPNSEYMPSTVPHNGYDPGVSFDKSLQPDDKKDYQLLAGHPPCDVVRDVDTHGDSCAITAHEHMSYLSDANSTFHNNTAMKSRSHQISDQIRHKQRYLESSESQGIGDSMTNLTDKNESSTTLAVDNLNSNSVVMCNEVLCHADNNSHKLPHNNHSNGGISDVERQSAVLDCEILRKEIVLLKSQLEDRDSQLHFLSSSNKESVAPDQQQSVTPDQQQSVTRESQQYHNSLSHIKYLEKMVSYQKKEVNELQEKLTSHDAAAKRAICTLQDEMQLRVTQVSKMYEDCVKEKDSMVVKYAQAERKNTEIRQLFEKADGKVRELLREQERLNGSIKALQTERQRALNDWSKKNNELESSMKEIEKMKEALSSSEVRTRWMQNKHKAEVDAHRETQVKLEKMTSKFKESKEESDQIRRDCQKMIEAYQNSEEMRSNSLESELKQQIQAKSDKDELHDATMKELESIKGKHKNATQNVAVLKEKLNNSERERFRLEEEAKKLDDLMAKQKKELKSFQLKVESLSHLQSEFERAQSMIKSLDQDMNDKKLTNKDLQIEIDACRKRESELLNLTENLSAKNALLQADSTSLNTQVLTYKINEEKVAKDLEQLTTSNQDLSTRLTVEQSERSAETTQLKKEVEEKSIKINELIRNLEDERDEIKMLKRKHISNTKDLTRQLQQTKKKLESLEQSHEERSVSRTSSNGSISQNADNHSQGSSTSQVLPRSQSFTEDAPVITEQVEVDKQDLIERIVKLQRMLAKKSEKMEFMEDHITQLLDEIQRKSRIIQMYIMREEAGVLAPESLDLSKLTAVKQDIQSQLSKKGGIMSSVYNSQVTDGHMSLELSLEINNKLQAVLEDTLLKNMTLKENFDTLGEEIARLSRDNRNLQILLQNHEKTLV